MSGEVGIQLVVGAFGRIYQRCWLHRASHVASSVKWHRAEVRLGGLVADY